MKKSLLVCVSILLLAAFAIGGTLAYLTDTDSAVNVMTVGNVKIKQNEQERDEDGKLVDYKDQPILPAVYGENEDSIPWADKGVWVKPNEEAWRVVEKRPNVIDKFVTVTNNGNTDAYVRTVFAFESTPFTSDEMIHIVINSSNVSDEIVWDVVGTIKLDGTDYQLAVATYQKKLQAGATTIPSLKQIYLDKKADNADLVKYGTEYKVYAVSQAVQASGFKDVNEAFAQTFGEINTTNHPWANITIVDSVESLTQALGEGENVYLSNDIDMGGDPVALADGAVINGNGKTISNATFTVANGNTASFENVKFDETTTIQAASSGNELNFTNCEFNITPDVLVNNSRAAAIIGTNQSNTVDLYLDGCTFNYQKSDADTYNAAIFMWSSVKNVEIKNCTFNNYGFVAVKLMNAADGANIVFENNTFNMSENTAENYWYNCAVQIVPQHDNAMSVTFKNNKFTGDYQTGADLVNEFGFSAGNTDAIVAEIAGMNYEFGLSNLTLTLEGNTVNGDAATEANFAVKTASNNG